MKDNLQRLAQWYRTSDCTVHPQSPAESLAKAIQEALGGYKNLCNPKDLERLKGIWNAVVKASPETTMKPRKESVLEMPKKEDPRRITVTSAKRTDDVVQAPSCGAGSVGRTLSKPLPDRELGKSWRASKTYTSIPVRRHPEPTS